MTEDKPQLAFTETQHALLFGWLAKAIIGEVGAQTGEVVLRKAIHQYGNERGQRMAMRAKANHHALNMANYLIYSEWKASPGHPHEMQIVEKAPNLKTHIHKCPWHKAWQENDLLSYARFYCLEIDRALVQGFNPDLYLEVNGTLTNGADRCEFVYRGANLKPFNYLMMVYKKLVKPAKSAVMPWEYHAGHLYHTVARVVGNELGEAGITATQSGLEEFTQRYGEQAAQIIMAYHSEDFGQLPNPNAGPI